MNASHWTDGELLEYFYGLKAPDQHLASCPQCAARAENAARIRKDATAAPEISVELLDAQRRAIYRRLGSSPWSWHPMRWAVSMIVTLALVLGLTLFKPARPGLTRSHDDQFYAEISAIAQDPAPRAIQPIEALVADDIQE